MAKKNKLTDPIIITGFIAGIIMFLLFLCYTGWSIWTVILCVIICLMLVLTLAAYLLERRITQQKLGAEESLSKLVDSFAKSEMKNDTTSCLLSGDLERAKKLDAIIERLAQSNASDKEYRLAYEEFNEKEDGDKVLKIEEMIMKGASIEDILSVFAYERNMTTRTRVLKKAFNKVFADISNSSEINLDKERIINSVGNHFGISFEDLKSLSNYNDYIKTLQVQDILQGHTPSRFTTKGIPINLQKNETPIWAFTKTDFYEEKVKRTYVGGSSGFSIRLAKGVYYRVGAFRGESVVKSHLTHMYTGYMVLTDKNIYFYSREKSMKFPYSKIVSYIPFEDGIGIQLDRVNAKPVFIQNIDGRFAYNIVSNINNLS